MERESVKVCELELGERYSIDYSYNKNHFYVVGIDETGVWVKWQDAVDGLFRIDVSFDFYPFPMSSLEKELV